MENVITYLQIQYDNQVKQYKEWPLAFPDGNIPTSVKRRMSKHLKFSEELGNAIKILKRASVAAKKKKKRKV